MLIQTFWCKFIFKMKIFFLPQSQNSRHAGDLSTVVRYTISLLRFSLEEKLENKPMRLSLVAVKTLWKYVFLGWALEGLVDFSALDILTHSKQTYTNKPVPTVLPNAAKSKDNTMLQPRALYQHVFKRSYCGLSFPAPPWSGQVPGDRS